MTDSIDWFGGSPRSPCSIDPETRRLVEAEIADAPQLLAGLRRLDDPPLAGQWQTVMDQLERAGASWSVVSCLCHPSPDVQLAALRAIRRLRDRRVLDLLVRYAGSLAGPIVGSEEATIRAVLRSEAERALEALTGSTVEVSWNDALTAQGQLERWRGAEHTRKRGGNA